jgi:hypothetical protein
MTSVLTPTETSAGRRDKAQCVSEGALTMAFVFARQRSDPSSEEGGPWPETAASNSADTLLRGEWPGGIAPPGSLRTVHEPLDSHGSHHPPVGGTPRRQ